MGQPVASLEEHIFDRVAGAIYGQCRGTHFWPRGWRNLWPVLGDAFLAIWLAQPMACLGDTFLTAWPAQPMASLGDHIFGGLAGATYG